MPRGQFEWEIIGESAHAPRLHAINITSLSLNGTQNFETLRPKLCFKILALKFMFQSWKPQTSYFQKKGLIFSLYIQRFYDFGILILTVITKFISTMGALNYFPIVLYNNFYNFNILVDPTWVSFNIEIIKIVVSEFMDITRVLDYFSFIMNCQLFFFAKCCNNS